MYFSSTILTASFVLVIPGSAVSQPVEPSDFPRTTGAIIAPQTNTTGNDPDVIIARGATGAETLTTNSAAGGNASMIERPVPNGSANGGSGAAGGG